MMLFLVCIVKWLVFIVGFYSSFFLILCLSWILFFMVIFLGVIEVKV